jgi:hypothetical protein
MMDGKERKCEKKTFVALARHAYNKQRKKFEKGRQQYFTRSN